MANLHIQESRCAGISRIIWASQFASRLSAIYEIKWSAKLRLCFVRDFSLLFDSFIIIFATVLALRAEIMGGVSMSTSVPGGPRAPLPRYWHWQLYGVRTRVRRPASLTRLDEYRIGSVDEWVGIIISTPIKRMTRRDAGKVNLVIT